MFTELQKTDILAAKEVLLDNLIPFVLSGYNTFGGIN
jgi:hypothetical protein